MDILVLALLLLWFVLLHVWTIQWISTLPDEAIEALNNVTYLDDGAFIYWPPIGDKTTDEAPHDEG